MKIYNGEGIILGRLASLVAKDVLLGEEVRIVNCEKVFISGKKENTQAHEKQRRDRKGYPLKSAKFSRLPDRFVRRSVRGMLPWKEYRGREAFKRVLCFIGLPEEFASQHLISAHKESVKKLPSLKYTTVGEICRALGGKIKP